MEIWRLGSAILQDRVQTGREVLTRVCRAHSTALSPSLFRCVRLGDVTCSTARMLAVVSTARAAGFPCALPASTTYAPAKRRG